jgi:hypothetical protein
MPNDLKAGITIPITLVADKSDGTAEDRSVTESNMSLSMNATNGAFGTLTKVSETEYSLVVGTNVGDTADFTASGHVKFADGEEYDITGTASRIVSADAEAGDTLEIHFGPVTPAA